MPSSSRSGFTLTEVIVSMGLLGLVLGLFYTSNSFITRSNYSKKAEIVLRSHSELSRLNAGLISDENEPYTKLGIKYVSRVDTVDQDTILYSVQAIEVRTGTEVDHIHKMKLRRKSLE